MELARLREKPIAQIAKDLSIVESGLRGWMKQADIDDGKSEALTADERKGWIHAEEDRRGAHGVRHPVRASGVSWR